MEVLLDGCKNETCLDLLISAFYFYNTLKLFLLISIQYMETSQSTISYSPANVVYDQDFVVVYQALDKELCRSVVDLFDQDESKWRGKIAGAAGNGSYEEETKSSWDLEILNKGIWQDIFQAIHLKIEACMSHYLSKSPVLQSFDLQVTGYKIQMYPKNEGYFRWHADSVGKHNGNRVVAMVLYLNDVGKGGETEFFHQGIKISPKAGYLVLFPTGWNYMHCGHMPESNAKYIIQTFIAVKD
ncbi:2OG-Fe(II) oxygenase [Methylobacillus arboreus]|uniref:2OG-Fe(II) oxygenase n=1 Tax=Methylobacillus arboreus TaxID=755170 RepID=UPI001E2AFDA6|nr:2OG-Fe(II) oxygenase [Methylobacillus arboreus]MCB5189140.1 2OG-Fe(II) oxygenase [Methylobacillus arboreus]